MPTEPQLVLQFVGTIADRLSNQFPRHCPACDRRYGTFVQYLADTVPVGYPMEYDTDVEDPFGIVDFSNCPCGTTLSVRWEGPPSAERAALREAIREDAQRTGRSATAVLVVLRSAIARAVTGAT
jgi:hypothetical protein